MGELNPQHPTSVRHCNLSIILIFVVYQFIKIKVISKVICKEIFKYIDIANEVIFWLKIPFYLVNFPKVITEPLGSGEYQLGNTGLERLK